MQFRRRPDDFVRVAWREEGSSCDGREDLFQRYDSVPPEMGVVVHRSAASDPKYLLVIHPTATMTACF